MTNIINETKRTSTWSGIGYDMNVKDVDTALNMAHLNYTVSLNPIYSKINDKEFEIPSKKSVIRDTDGHFYNIVSDGYVPFQNHEAFDFLHYLNEDMTIVKAGETYNGLVYVIGELREMNILGDKFKLYAIFQNGHNGHYKTATTICPLRMVCENQFNLSFRETNSTFAIKHTKNIHNSVKNAIDSLSKINEYTKIFNEKAQLLASKKISHDQVIQFLDFMFPVRPEATNAELEKSDIEKHKFLTAYNCDDNQNFKGSAWGLLNGLTDYITHSEFKRKVDHADEKIFVRTIVDSSINTPFQYLTEMVK